MATKVGAKMSQHRRQTRFFDEPHESASSHAEPAAGVQHRGSAGACAEPADRYAEPASSDEESSTPGDDEPRTMFVLTPSQNGFCLTSNFFSNVLKIIF